MVNHTSISSRRRRYRASSAELIVRDAMKILTSWRVSTLLVATAALSGCGTIGSMVVHPTENFGFYSGVRQDFGPCPNLLDVPFSLVLDTAILPVSIPFSLVRAANREDASPEGNQK